MNIYAHYTRDQVKLVRAKPRHRMRQFAAMLGWRGLQQYQMAFSRSEMQTWNFPWPGVVVYYATPGTRFFLQINEALPEDDFTHNAAVVAERYGLRPLGWHPLTLFEDDECLAQEAERLKPRLDRRLFKNRRWIAEFKQQHPELVLCGKGKKRGGRS